MNTASSKKIQLNETAFKAECIKRYGPYWQNWEFECPVCKSVQTVYYRECLNPKCKYQPNSGLFLGGIEVYPRSGESYRTLNIKGLGENN